jgi:L-2-hydroxyglutarate oxidase LhgO
MTVEKVQVHATVIGGGIVGLLTALELKKRFPNEDVALIEKAPYLADHSTGRNSGVLHSGLYYETGSLKHTLCLAGLAAWKPLIAKFSIPHHWCGKVIFAHKQNEVPRLEELQKRAQINGVPSHRASSSELKSAQERVTAVDALIIESTGIIDICAAMAILRTEFENLGGIIQTSTFVSGIQREKLGFTVLTANFNIDTKLLVNAAGLWAPEVRAMLGFTNMTSRWVKGHYLKTSQKLNYDTLYYPVPPADLKGLGVHSTIDCQGDVKFGPDTLDVTEIDYKLETQNLESMRASVKERFIGVDSDRLMPDYAGIRSKIEVEGTLHKDFWIKSPLKGYAEACGIESPGMTSAPAIAKILCDLL